MSYSVKIKIYQFIVGGKDLILSKGMINTKMLSDGNIISLVIYKIIT